MPTDDEIPDETGSIGDELSQSTLLDFLRRRRPCPICETRGRVSRGGVECECATCRGTGYVRLGVRVPTTQLAD